MTVQQTLTTIKDQVFSAVRFSLFFSKSICLVSGYGQRLPQTAGIPYLSRGKYSPYSGAFLFRSFLLFTGIFLFNFHQGIAQSGNCNCTGNLIENGTFEGSAITNWTKDTAAGVNYDSGYDLCGSKTVRIARSSGSGLLDPALWQQENSIEAGKIYTLSFDAGTQDPGKLHRMYLRFYNSGGTLLAQDYLEVNHNVDSNGKLQSSSFSVAAPSGSSYLRAAVALDGDKIWLDNVCLIKSACAAPTFNFQTPVLVSGTLGADGSRYKYYNALTGTDATLTIVSRSHADIVIKSMDEEAITNGGYDWAFQPIIDYNWFNGGGNYDPAGEKSVTFKFDFVDALTGAAKVIPQISMTAVDVDGDNVNIKEFVQAGGFQSYEIQSPTQLTLSGALKAKSNLTNWPGVSETALSTMISYVYNNASSITVTYGGDYNGGNGVNDNSESRMNCLFFKCYDFNSQVVCPSISVSGGNFICSGGSVILNASNTAGTGTCTIQWQSSSNGTAWTNINGATGVSYTTPAITVKTYYRATFNCTGITDCGTIFSNVDSISVQSVCTEICNNGIDDDGDGFIDGADAECIDFNDCTASPGQNKITGNVFIDANGNQVIDNGESLQPGVTVTLFQDINQNGQVDGGDTQLQTKVTDSSGKYSFIVTPVYTASYNAKVSHACNDGKDGNNSENKLLMGKDKDIGLRFTGIDIPAGATITGAYLYFVAKSSNNKTGSMNIYAHKKSNPEDYCVNNTVTSRSRTTAWKAWSTGNWTANSEYQSADIKNVIQELVDSYGAYANGQMALLLLSNGSDNMEAKSFETNNNSTEAPRLVINYTVNSAVHYLVRIEPATFPANTVLTTPNVASAVFTQTGTADCNNNFGIRSTIEICGNGIDDEGDGLADCLDGECGGIPSASINAGNADICAGGSTTLTASATGGAGPLSYTWNNGLGSGFAKTVSPSVSTTYTVTVISVNGCTATSQVTVTVNSIPAATTSATATICGGTSTAISVAGSGGTSPYSYNWSHSLGTGSSKSVSPASTTTYTVTLTDAKGCSATGQVLVNVNPSPAANAGPDVTICKFATTTLTATATGGTTPYTFTWNNGLGSGASKTVSPSTTTAYIVTVTSANGCIHTDAVIVTVNNCIEICNNGLDDDFDGFADCLDSDCGPTVSAGSGVSICGGTGTTLTASATGGVAPFTYQWSHSLGSGASKTVTPATTTTYTVTVTSASGCTGTGAVTVTIVTCSENCSNGIDDDGDGQVDCNDPDCAAIGQPVLVNDAYATCPGIPYTERVTYNDGNLQSPSFSIYSQPAHGTVTIDGTGKFVYTPFTSNCLIDVFVYQVCNQTTGCCATASVTLTIGDNTPPVLLNVPADITIGCDETVPSPPLVYGYDACPGIYISFDEVSTVNNSSLCNSYTITRTWQAADLCGNVSSASQVIHVQDLTAPEIFRVYTLPNGRKMFAGISQRNTHNWKYVKFPIQFGNTPLVFSQVVSDVENSAVTIRQRNVTKQGFELRLREEENADGIHQPESIAWVAMEPGSLDGVMEMEAGLLANVTHNWQALNLAPIFTQVPGLIVSVQTNVEADPVTVRFKNPAAAGTEIHLEEETSKDAEVAHGPESLAYLAMKPGQQLKDASGDFIGEAGSVNISNAWATVTLSRSYHKPVVVTGGLSKNDTEPATIRVRNVTANSFEVRVQEWNSQDGAHGTETAAWFIMEGSIPADAVFYCDGQATNLQMGVNIFSVDNCDIQVDFSYNETSQLLPNGMLTNRVWTALDDCGNISQASRYDTCGIAAVRLKALLAGATINNGGGLLMRDDLRQNGFVPAIEPYTGLSGFLHKGPGGGETINPAMLTVTGNDAIVDWVFIELRDAGNDKTVIATTAALIQRDGDIVSITGDSVIYFPGVGERDYYVAVRHRNHLGIMTDGVWHLSSFNVPLIDFKDVSLPVRGGVQAGRISGGARSLWAGDMNGDRKVIYQGPNNDIFFLFSFILSDSGNIAFLANYIRPGYHRQDFNMDGKVIYQGPNNDRGLLLYHTVMSHPANASLLANYIAAEKIP